MLEGNKNGFKGARMVETLFWLLTAHAVADFGLQSDWMARHKNRHLKDVKIRGPHPEWVWFEVLSAHSAIHAAGVALATGSVLLGVLEFVAHWIIDFCKCENYYGFHTDQLLHVASKFLWLVLLAYGVA